MLKKLTLLALFTLGLGIQFRTETIAPAAAGVIGAAVAIGAIGLLASRKSHGYSNSGYRSSYMGCSSCARTCSSCY